MRFLLKGRPVIGLDDWLYNTVSFENTKTMFNAVEQKLYLYRVAACPLLLCVLVSGTAPDASGRRTRRCGRCGDAL